MLAPPGRRGSLPSETHDGWLSRKNEKKRRFGKASWEKFWAVLDPELWSVRFYETQQDFFNGEESGEISLQRLKLVAHLVDKKEGRRFNIVAFDGTEHCFVTETAPEASRWVEVLKNYEKAPLPRFSIGMDPGFNQPDLPLGEDEEEDVEDTAPKLEDEETADPIAVVEAPLPKVVDKEEKDAEEDAAAKDKEQGDEEQEEEEKPKDNEDEDAQKEEDGESGKKFIDALAPLTKIRVGGKDKKAATDAQGRKFKDAFAPLTKKGSKSKVKEGEATDTRGRRFTDALAPLTVKPPKPDKPEEIPEEEEGAEQKKTDEEEKDQKKKKKKEKVTKSSGSFTVKLRGEDIKINASIEKARTTTFVTWGFVLGSDPFKIELEHGRVFGKRVIAVNGVLVHQSRVLLDDGSRHVLELSATLKLAVVIASKGFSGFSYLLQFIPVKKKPKVLEQPPKKEEEEEAAPKKEDQEEAEPKKEDNDAQEENQDASNDAE